MKILTVSQMMEVDRLSSEECGIPSILLMENAGICCFRALEEEFADELGELRVVVVCGKGNNGGDGLVVARQLRQRGMSVRVFLLGRVQELSGDARINADILLSWGMAVHEVLDDPGFDELQLQLGACEIIVDALLGTGLSSPLRGLHARAVEAINQASAYRLAVDIPSGMFADSTRSSGLSVEANRTITFSAPKIAHILNEDLDCLGRLSVVPIGSPDRLLQREDYELELIDEGLVRSCLLSRPINSYKGSYGHLLILAGSRGKSGAAAMAARSALRAGAGLVTVALPRGIQSEVASSSQEAMTEGLSEDQEGALDASAWGAFEKHLPGKSALAIGPGMSLRPGAKELVRRVLVESELPVVLDAGGVDALTGHLELLERRRAPLILTPHPGEFSRLTGMDRQQIESGRIEVAKTFSQRYGVWLVLKGFRSLVASPEGKVRVCPLGNPGMATAGMGDVLTGVIGGLLAGQAARGSADGAWAASTAGLYVHSLAGDLASRRRGLDGLVSGDVIDSVAEALSLLRS